MAWFKVSYGDDEFFLIIKATNEEEAKNAFIRNRTIVLKPAWPKVEQELSLPDINVERSGDPFDMNSRASFAVL